MQLAAKQAGAFRRIFAGEDGKIALDLLKSHITRFHPDPYQHAFGAGKNFIVVDVILDALDDEKHEANMKQLKELEENAGTNTNTNART